MTEDHASQALRRELDHVRVEYELHFSGLPRATRSVERADALARRIDALLEVVGRAGQDEVVDTLRGAREFLESERRAIEREASNPLGILVAEATMSGKIVEARLRRHLGTGEPWAWSPLHYTLMHEDAFAAWRATSELAGHLPPTSGTRWLGQMTVLLEQISYVADRCESVRRHGLTVPREQVDARLHRCARALSPTVGAVREAVETGWHDASELRAEADVALTLCDGSPFAVNGSTAEAFDLARGLDEQADHTVSLQRRARQDGRYGAKLERAARQATEALGQHLPCVVQTVSVAQSLTEIVDLLSALHRLAVRHVGEDTVLTSVPWIAELRDALYCGERWLLQVRRERH